MSSIDKRVGPELGAETDAGATPQALAFVNEADALIRKRLPERGWSQRKTVDRFLADDRLERVLARYSRALRLDPTEPAYPWNLAGMLKRLGLHDLALSYIERAIRVAQDIGDHEWADAGAHLAWAEAALCAGQQEVAVVALARVANLARRASPAASSVRLLLAKVSRSGASDAPLRASPRRCSYSPADLSNCSTVLHTPRVRTLCRPLRHTSWPDLPSSGNWLVR